MNWQVWIIRLSLTKKSGLGNDYKSIMKEIEIALQAVHHHAKLEPVIQPPRIPDRPFARIYGIAPDSPAWDAGLRRGDEIVKFGTIDNSLETPLKQLADKIPDWEGVATRVQCRRDGSTLIFMVTPSAKWNGKGLLGYRLIYI